MREIVHIQAGQCGNQIGAKVSVANLSNFSPMNLLVRQKVCKRIELKFHSGKERRKEEAKFPFDY